MLYFLLILNIICSFIPLIARNKQSGLRLSIILIFLFLALRYNFGNDYMAYYDTFNSMSFNDRADADMELGYNLLCSIFEPLGFFSLQIFLAGIYCYALYRTIISYIKPGWYWLAILFIISNPDLLFFGASAFRQTLALSIILLSIPYLQRKSIVYIFMVLLATQFHQSAMFFLLLYPLMFIKLNNQVFIILFGLLSVALMTVLKDQFYALINIVLSSFEKYEARYGDSDLVLMESTLGIAIRMFFMVFFLYSLRKSENQIISIFYILAVLCIVIFTMREQVMLQRYTMYFGYMMSFSFINVLETLKRKSVMTYAYIAIVLFWHFRLALNFASSTNALFEYHTIFEIL